MNQKSLSQLIDSSYYDYSMYVMESRAIPSMIDGFKPSQRKALYSALRTARSFIKTASLTGETLKQGYHHGDASMNDAIGKLVAPWNNNAPILEGEGGFGNRFDKSQSAARYTKVKVSSNFNRYFSDNDILTEHLDPEIPEPVYYLPLIPWVLTNGTSGVAIGFACEIQPRDPKALVKACIKAATGKNVTADELPPAYLNTRCKVGREPVTDRWYIEGTVRQLNAYEVLIEELPPAYDRRKFVERLDKLEETSKIVSYEDECGKGSNGFKFRVKFKRGGMPDQEGMIKLFGLRQILSENLTVVDEHGKLRQYNEVGDLVADFVKFRVDKVKERFEHYIERDTKRLWDVNMKATFVTHVLSGAIEFIGKSKAQISANMAILNFRPADTEMCLRMSVSNLNKDTLAELEQESKDIEKAIIGWQNADPAAVYQDELKALLKP